MNFYISGVNGVEISSGISLRHHLFLNNATMISVVITVGITTVGTLG